MNPMAGDTFQSVREFPLQVRHDGSVLWGHTTMMDSPCDVDMSTFPFDRQICYIIYGVLTSDIRTIVVDAESDYIKRLLSLYNIMSKVKPSNRGSMFSRLNHIYNHIGFPINSTPSTYIYS